MAELVMRKRPAMHAGELGLFIDSEVFEEDFESIKSGSDVNVNATQSRNLKQMRLAWGLAGKIAKSGAAGDADKREVMDYLLMKAKHVRYVTTTLRDGITETIPVPKSIRFAALEQTAFNRIFNRMIFIVITELLPDVPEGVLRDEIEKMSGVTAPEPDKPKATRRRLTAEERSARNLAIAEGRPEPQTVGAIIEQHDADGVLPDHSNALAEYLDANDPRGDVPPVSEIPAGPDQVDDLHAPAPSPSDDVVPPPTQETANQEPEPALPASLTVAAVATQAPPPPKNPDQWVTWTRHWLAAFEVDLTKSDQDVMVRWGDERKIRNDCGVTEEVRTPVFTEYAATLERMHSRGK